MEWHRFLQSRPEAYLGRGDSSRRALALTFDDGPGQATPALLAALSELRVQASFFCTGAAANESPQLIARMLSEGHEVGNHSQAHLDARGIGAQDWFAREVAPAAACLREAGWAERPRMFRPAYGEIDEAQYDALASAGYAVIGWSVDPRDWLEPDAPGYVSCVVESVLARIHPGAIVLLHDGDDERGRGRESIVDIVRKLVPALRGQGYEFVKVSEYLPAG